MALDELWYADGVGVRRCKICLDKWPAHSDDCKLGQVIASVTLWCADPNVHYGDMLAEVMTALSIPAEILTPSKSNI